MNVSSVKNLNGETFSAVQDTFLTNIVSSNSANWNEISAYQANSGNFLTAVPDTYLQNTDLSTEDGKVTAISGIPLSAGGDVPEGVMVESGLEYNAVNEISAYNGSAIAQYGAEKQWLVHDDTLVHAANSAQYALGCNISALQRLMGIDETVLWSGEANSGTFTEDISGFDRLKVLYIWNPFTNNKAKYVELQAIPQTFSYLDNGRADNTYNWFAWGSWNIENTGFSLIKGFQSVGNLNSTTESTAPRMYKVIGIGRKQ